MGALSGACLLALSGAWLASELYGNFEGMAAMGGAELGGLAGAALGLGLGLWLVLRKNGESAGSAVAGLTGAAVMILFCVAFVAFA
jgi:hypothetical protein